MLHCHGYNHHFKPPLQTLPGWNWPIARTQRTGSSTSHTAWWVRKAQVWSWRIWQRFERHGWNVKVKAPHWASRIQSYYSQNQSASMRGKTFHPQHTTTACLGVGDHGDKLKHHHTHIFNLDAVHHRSKTAGHAKHRWKVGVGKKQALFRFREGKEYEQRWSPRDRITSFPKTRIYLLFISHQDYTPATSGAGI